MDTRETGTGSSSRSWMYGAIATSDLRDDELGILVRKSG